MFIFRIAEMLDERAEWYNGRRKRHERVYDLEFL